MIHRGDPERSAPPSRRLVGALADKIGYAPLFALLGVFEIAGAIALFPSPPLSRLDADEARA
jgi:hypothetical protein